VQFLRELADSGQAILCTIHQPSAELFQSFDRLLLLKKGGQTVYFGPLGHHSQAMIDYFEGNGARHIEEVENPAEYMLDIIGAGATATADRDWHEAWKSSKNSQDTQDEIDGIHREGRNRPAVEVKRRSEYAASWPYQVAMLMRRNLLDTWRDPTYLISKFALNIAGGLFIGYAFSSS
jgi:ATP-binding cassette, subfamily G (WHITE), member 2, SNQ2